MMSVFPTKVFWKNSTLCPGNQVIIGYGGIPLEELNKWMDALKDSLLQIVSK